MDQEEICTCHMKGQAMVKGNVASILPLEKLMETLDLVGSCN